MIHRNYDFIIIMNTDTFSWFVHNRCSKLKGGRQAAGVGVTQDKYLKREEAESCHRLGGAGEGPEGQGGREPRAEVVDSTLLWGALQRKGPCHTDGIVQGRSRRDVERV